MAQPDLIQIPEHELIRRIGRGSYGEVWLAKSSLGEMRAVKIVWRSRFTDDRPFTREFSGIKAFEPISRSHPGFVPILQVGRNEEAEYFYYVMEAADNLNGVFDLDNYVPATLASRMARSGRCSVTEAVEAGIAIAEALSCLHGKGLAHRDIKPSNILLIHSRPRLCDIGLIAKLDDPVSMVGTPGFMPLEGPGTMQADIYSLGKVLYEISTGQDRHSFPDYPNPEGFADYERFFELNEVLLKACQADPRRRYQSADAMIEDLRLVQAGESVRKLRRLERLTTQWKRAASVALAVIAIGGVISYPIYRENQILAAAKLLDIGRTRAVAQEALNNGEYYRALGLFLDQSLAIPRSPEEQADENLRLNSIMDQCPTLHWAHKFRGPIGDLELAKSGDTLVLASYAATAWVVNLDGSDLREFKHHYMTLTADLSDDGKRLATGGADAILRVWDVEKRALVCEITTPSPLLSVQFMAGDENVVAGADDGTARIWNIENRTLLTTVSNQTTIDHAITSDKNNWIATAGRDGTARLWDATAQTELARFKHGSWVFSAEFSPDGERLLTSSFDRRARLWDIQHRRELVPAMRHDDGVASASFSPDLTQIVTAGYDSNVRLWSAETGEQIAPIFPQGNRAIRARFSPDQKRLVTACWDGTVRTYDLASVQRAIPDGARYSPDFQARLNGNGVEYSPFSSETPSQCPPDTRAFWSYAKQGAWVKLSGEAPGVITAGEQDRVRWKAPLPADAQGEKILLSAAGVLVPRSESVVCHSWADGAPLWTLPVTNVSARLRIFVQDRGNTLLLAAGPEFQVWDVREKPVFLWRGRQKSPIESAAFSPNGDRVVTTDADAVFNGGAARVWDIKTGARLIPPLEHKDGILHATFSVDSRFIVTASEDFTASIWDAQTGARLVPRLRHEHQVAHAAVSANGRWVATASRDRTARVWDIRTGEALTPPLRHANRLRSCAFGPGDSTLMTRDELGGVSTWKLSTAPVDVPKLRAFLALTAGEDNRAVAENWARFKQ